MKQNHVWAFEHCGCVYESDFRLVSLHSRAVSAYKAMKAFRAKEIERETWQCLSDLGYFLYPHGARDKGGMPHWTVRIRKIEVLDE